MTKGSNTKGSSITIRCSQIEDAKEFLDLLKTLNSDEKKELRGMIRGMRAMKEILTGRSA